MKIILSSYAFPICRNFLLFHDDIRPSNLLMCRQSVGWYSYLRPSLFSPSRTMIGVFHASENLHFFVSSKTIIIDTSTTASITRHSWCKCQFRLENPISGHVIDIPFVFCGDLSPPDMAAHLLVELCSWINGPTGFDGLRKYFENKGGSLRHPM